MCVFHLQPTSSATRPKLHIGWLILTITGVLCALVVWLDRLPAYLEANTHTLSVTPKIAQKIA